MAKSKELEQIKKIYGEKFMHLCRKLFPTLLEKEGVLLEVLSSIFATNSRTLGEDITWKQEEDFKNFIYSKVDVEKKKPEIITKKNPYQLLEEAGYDLFECTSEDEIQSFKKYYKPEEELCTFWGGRLSECVVFWAVKKDVAEIKREDFESPRREDEYGTSVMSIQFSRGESSTVSIKNRYNHTVNNPDATYGNDLDRIIPGLTKSFAELLAERGMELDNMNIESLEIPGYTVASDGKYYKYNREINGIYYCPGNVIIDHGKIVKLEPERFVLMDYFILDKKTKSISVYDDKIEDCFASYFDKDGIEKIEVKKSTDKEKGSRTITITRKESDIPVVIEIDKDNQITGFTDEQVTEIGDNFMHRNFNLYTFQAPKLAKVGNYFLMDNSSMMKLSLPNLAYVGNHFLVCNEKLTLLDLPNLEEVGREFLRYNQSLRSISLKNLKKIGFYFLAGNEILSQVELPNVTQIKGGFLYENRGLKQLELPNLINAGATFLSNNEDLYQLQLPKLQELGFKFLCKNKGLGIGLDHTYDRRMARSFREHPERLKEHTDQIMSILIKNNIVQKQVDIEESIDAKDIAELDKESELTTSEINGAKSIIEGIRSKEIEQKNK